MRRATPILLLALAVLAVSCSKEPAAPAPAAPAPAPKKEVKPKAQVEMPSLFERSDDYSYNPVGKRDPFMQLSEETVADDANLPKSPLERYSLDQLALTAIVWGITDPRALVQAPDNQSYIVKRNMRIGNHRGRVSRITKRSLFVEEEYRDPTGKLIVSEQVMEIRPEEKKNEGPTITTGEE
jgi:type IV pilus assembly protein PilP